MGKQRQSYTPGTTMSSSRSIFRATVNSTSFEVIEEVFLMVWPIARYVFFLIIFTVFVGTLLTGCIARGKNPSEEIRTEPETVCQRVNAWNRDPSCRSTAVSEEAYYESI
ncbi:hypothetical protein MATL_G00153980 [Megalops atlanticus]|uniref:Uncharacterized protein n=1 Tax=Megalops atlanticus TaxID=7932 RepID=A0A9D3PUV9_MEGAT|nr:hypothetical protein MATL_G00153980 [Megalops atlanticus]